MKRGGAVRIRLLQGLFSESMIIAAGKKMSAFAWGYRVTRASWAREITVGKKSPAK
jgi:hypothetical protein